MSDNGEMVHYQTYADMDARRIKAEARVRELEGVLNAIRDGHFYCVKCGKHGPAEEDTPFKAVPDHNGEWDLVCCGSTGNITDCGNEIAEAALKETGR